MRINQALVPAAGLFATAFATNGTVWTTVVTTDYTTYCPSPTTFAWHNVTYTATSETTVTVTNCPCTITYSQPPPVTTTSYPAGVPPPGTVSVPTSYYNLSSTVITYTPSLTTIISGTVPVTTPSTPTHTPIPPTSSGPVIVPTAAADKVGPMGTLLVIGLAALAL